MRLFYSLFSAQFEIFHFLRGDPRERHACSRRGRLLPVGVHQMGTSLKRFEARLEKLIVFVIDVNLERRRDRQGHLSDDL